MEEPIEIENLEILNTEYYKDAEWCFRFDNDEAVPFAWSDEQVDSDVETIPQELTFTIKADSGSEVKFTSPDGKTMTIFARNKTIKQ